jgi:hypothetical protein
LHWRELFFALTSNNLPVDGQIGDWPMSRDAALTAIDGNPAAPVSKPISLTLPAAPTGNIAPACVGVGTIGVSANGVALSNAADGRGNDAVATAISASAISTERTAITTTPRSRTRTSSAVIEVRRAHPRPQSPQWSQSQLPSAQLPPSPLPEFRHTTGGTTASTFNVSPPPPTSIVPLVGVASTYVRPTATRT